MIAIGKENSTNGAPVWHKEFLGMLPAIRTAASVAFRGRDAESREEAVQEVVCNSLVAYQRLVGQGRASLAFPSVLARYGIAQTRTGRKVGGKLNIRDVSSPYAQQQKGFALDRLDRFDRQDGWQEVVVEDRHAGPADIAATRIDVAAWLESLTPRMRRIATTLAGGETTKNAATMFSTSPGRISQIRRELMNAWHAFQGDEPTTRAASVAA